MGGQEAEVDPGLRRRLREAERAKRKGDGDEAG
jgi:hypothetical protein